VASGDLERDLARVVAALPEGGEARPGQVAMATAVAAALEARRHLVVRAGTGTGKSLAYLVPAVRSGRRVVVATATKALQDQLVTKDVPLVRAGLRRPVRAAVLKGRANYLCAQRVREAGAAGVQGQLGADERGSGPLAAQARRVLAWASSTSSGDRAELDFEVDPRVWSALSVTAEECPGASRCPAGDECFAEAARAAAAEADLVVVNLHLLGADLAGGGTVLPDHDALVVDEAHELEEVLSASLGASIGAGRLRALATAARLALGPARRADQEVCDALVDLAARFEGALAPLEGQRLAPDGLGGLAEVVELAATRLERLEAALRRREAASETDQRAARAARAAGRLREQLVALLALGPDDVAWVAGGERPTLELAPLELAPLLAERLFARLPVVLTSATVPPGLAARLGADPDRTDELDVGSPFHYEEHALLYCAAHLPDRRRPEAAAAIAEELAFLIDAAGGRTLALFTSRAAMLEAAAAVRARVAYPVLVQGDAPKAALLAAFAAAPETCLFATMGFWQGVDVPGQTCSLVAIDRLPFSRPDDPLAAARRERAGPAAFRTVDLPRAASLLAQGAGRLVRTASDRGVVAVLDSRLATAPYRWDLVRALPPMRRTRSREEVAAFLRALRAGTSAPAASPA